MRRDIVVLGFFIIVLILTAGCSSPQNGVPTGSKSQNPTQVYTTGKITFESYMDPIFECNLPPKDPILFQKFLPNVPGYNRQFGQNLSVRSGNGVLEAIVVETKKNSNYHYSNRIGEAYFSISDMINWVGVYFEDLGPCAPSVDTRLNLFESYTFGEVTRSKINNFHGYPAVKTIHVGKKPGYVTSIQVDILITNRLIVGITAADFTGEHPLSDTEADIERFANAIDFKGFSASV